MLLWDAIREKGSIEQRVPIKIPFCGHCAQVEVFFFFKKRISEFDYTESIKRTSRFFPQPNHKEVINKINSPVSSVDNLCTILLPNWFYANDHFRPSRQTN